MVTKTENLGQLDQYHIPECDYKPNGELKSFRWRIVFKLQKYELKHIIKSAIPVLIAYVALLILCIIFGNIMNYARAQAFENGTYINRTAETFASTFESLFGLTQCVLAVIPVATGFDRYYKNFFGKEGYLTLSVPASAKEQVLAKHFFVIITEFLTTIIIILGIIAKVLLTGGEINIIGFFIHLAKMPSLDIVNFAFLIANLIISSVSTVFFVGGLICFFKRLSKGQKILVGIVTYILIQFFFTFLLLSIITGLLSFDYAVVFLTLNCIWLAVSLICGICGYRLEINALSNKINIF